MILVLIDIFFKLIFYNQKDINIYGNIVSIGI